MIASTRRNVFLLAICQALFMTGTSLVLTVTALAGEAMAPGTGLATLPISLQFVLTMATTIPASFIMRRFGRRAGFQLGAIIGMIGGLINVWALVNGLFVVFCIGSALVGVLNGFALYYRFAAADCSDESFRPKAISLVLAGGVIAAFTGPNLAGWTAYAVDSYAFVGSYSALAAIQVAAIAILMFVDVPRMSAEERKEHGRPLAELLLMPPVFVAIIAGVAGYSSMSLIMTATPLAMHGVGHGLPGTTFVIQWHVFAMFAPAFVTGHLIKRLGVLPVITTGAALILICVAVIQIGTGMWEFTVALMALGVGWNFMFVGGTNLLNAGIDRSEHAKIQGINDFLIFGGVALASFSAGLLYENFGWSVLSYAAIPGASLSIVASIWLWQARSIRAV